MNPGNKIRFALVGCGRVSSSHLKAMQELNDRCELIAVCDIIQERAKAVGQKTGATVYTDLDALLKRDDIDIVSVATPSGLHPEHGRKVAEAGKHCIPEKPIGIRLNEVNEMIYTFEKSDKQLFAVMQNRYNTTMRLLKRAIDKGRFGKIFFAQTNIFWTRNQEYYDNTKWHGTLEFDGGTFFTQASHYVDSLYWLIGEVESVQAVTGTLVRDIETEDTGAAILQFRNGAIGSINVTVLTYPKNFEGSITIIGERGTVKVGGIAINKIEKWEFDTFDEDDKLIEMSNYEPPNVYGFGHLAYYKKVLDTLGNHGTPDISSKDGRKGLEIILAIHESSKTGERVAIQS